MRPQVSAMADGASCRTPSPSMAWRCSLRSCRASAVALNILIIRAFVRLREYLATNQDLARKLEDVERTQQEHGAHIRQIYDCIDRLLEPPESSKRRIGFAMPDERER